MEQMINDQTETNYHFYTSNILPVGFCLLVNKVLHLMFCFECLQVVIDLSAKLLNLG